MNNKEEFIVDGTFDNISYELKKELIQFFELSEKDVHSEQVSEFANYLVELMIQLNAPIDEKEKYQLGFFSPKKRYYVKIDYQVLLGLASLMASIFPAIAGFTTPGASKTSLIFGALGVIPNINIFRKSSSEIPEKDFCVMLCAHQKPWNQYISLHKITEQIQQERCPFMNLYKIAYNHPCNNVDRNGRCKLKEKDVKDSLDRLGRKFDILEISDGIYQIK